MVQYTRSPGRSSVNFILTSLPDQKLIFLLFFMFPDLRLVNALSKVYSPIFQREINPLSEVLTTVGATEAIFIVMQAFLNPGDECVLFEPYYDSYPPSVRMGGGIPVSVPLRPKENGTSSADWVLDRKEFERALSPKTKMILINNPMNVPGKVWDMYVFRKCRFESFGGLQCSDIDEFVFFHFFSIFSSDLQYIAEVAKKRDLIVVADEGTHLFGAVFGVNLFTIHKISNFFHIFNDFCFRLLCQCMSGWCMMA
jgi:bifunctional pyridoxal-dependent enzyme with beta-cystathionase and maltose regulon repressor activities